MDGGDMNRDRDRVRLLSNRIERSELKPGDHIYTWRIAYSYAHHGIYVGDNKVIHFTGGKVTKFLPSRFHPASAYCQACAEIKRQHESPANGGSAKEADIRDSSHGAGVCITCLDCFVHNWGHLYLYAYEVSTKFFLGKMHGTCTMARADPPEKVLHRAFYLLKHGYVKYDLFKHNCEDFSIYCKTELVIQSYIAGLSNQIQGKISHAMYMAADNSIMSHIMSEIDRYKSDIGVRKDATRVPVEKLLKAYEQKSACIVGCLGRAYVDH
ncbi:unnamed protein product [Urochloa decumbens]|uniref:LRAT domain-containing protein n=1 Tax=Urochloa decumbens TaxID=240449 RepID=A0ABC9CEI5_9POAL